MRLKDKCKTCKYLDRNKYVYPCDRCLSNNLPEAPVTCDDCRHSWFNSCKKGLRPCKNFEWS